MRAAGPKMLATNHQQASTATALGSRRARTIHQATASASTTAETNQSGAIAGWIRLPSRASTPIQKTLSTSQASTNAPVFPAAQTGGDLWALAIRQLWRKAHGWDKARPNSADLGRRVFSVALKHSNRLKHEHRLARLTFAGAVAPSASTHSRGR